MARKQGRKMLPGALLVLAAWMGLPSLLAAGWLPFLNSKQGQRYVPPTPVPTPTPCMRCVPHVLFSYPSAHQVVRIPYDPLNENYDSTDPDSRLVVSLIFDQDMDTPSVDQAVSVNPACSYAVLWSGRRRLSLGFSTMPGADPQHAQPLPFGKNLVLSLGAGAMAFNGMHLAPYTLTFTTGGFETLRVNGDLPSSYIPLSLDFNGPVDPNQSLAGKLKNDAGLDLRLSRDCCDPADEARLSAVGLVKPATAYHFTALPGIRSTGGQATANTAQATVTSAPLSCSIAAPVCARCPVTLDFNYPMDHAAAERAVSISPRPRGSELWVASPCEDELEIFGLQSGLSYNVSVSTSAQAASGGRLDAPRQLIFVAP